MKIYQPTKPLPTRRNEAWAVNVAKLDIPNRPTIMMVVDIGTRRLLSATVSLAVSEDIVATLERLTRRTGCPRQIWVDHSSTYRWGLFQDWSRQRGIEILHGPGPQARAVTEGPLRHLCSSLHAKHLPTLMELGHEIERWRQSYVAPARTAPELGQ
ncbi:transposase InsO family protein [Bradyrhizobium diazoefficiens]